MRLHGTKDYSGMALLLEEARRVKATVNLVPSLVDQIDGYATRGARDRWLALHEREVGSLSHEERAAVLETAFMASDRAIAAHPRYAELKRLRDLDPDPRRAACRFADRDLRDLEVHFALAWMHPLLREREPVARELWAKGRAFAEEEKGALLARSVALLSAICPRWRDLEASGQVELSATPYYHPILPLLLDLRSAREALPDLPIPGDPTALADDAEEQVRRAVEAHRATFGRAPRGMWPAEGSVSAAAIPLFSGHGVRWIATDEAILARTRGLHLARTGEGDLLDPEPLYRPYAARHAGAEVSVFFRDRLLSDLLGFKYQHLEATAAAADFLGRVERALRRAGRDILVTVALDGENCWEHYPENGVPFLRELYRRLSEHPRIETATASEALERVPPRGEPLDGLAAGSWIGGNFAIWIGHEDDRAAWRMVLDAKAAWRRAAEARAGAEALARAREEILAAEGSDWYWWYGPENHSPLDHEFDALFRRRVRNAYEALGLAVPARLYEPVAPRPRAKESKVRPPRELLDVKVDGRNTTYYEWATAGHYRADRRGGAMHEGGAPLLRDVRYGFDRQRLLVRVDFDGDSDRILVGSRGLRLRFREPRPLVAAFAGDGPLALEPDQGAPARAGEAASRQVLEMALPFSAIGAGPGVRVAFAVELTEQGRVTERAPPEGAIAFDAPGADFEARNWVV